MIVAESGTHFDPDVIDIFNSIDDEVFETIGQRIQ
jgi:response regulator RpfG family c-di-GMP phosphodiesterase